MSDRPWSSTAPPGEFRTYVPAEETLKEFTIRAVILGALFGLLFGAVTVYVGLRAGLTVSASIPISVLSISILRAFGRSTILENNIVQTTGSAGESLAAGVMFTIPALIFLGFGAEFTFWRIFPLALLGGWLGVLFMVPLRRQLIVKEHGNLTFPEGTACADVLVAGERGGSFAGRVFWGLGLGGVYTFLMNTVQAWTSQPESRPTWFQGASFRAAITSEYLGVGYIIGPRVAGLLFAGGIISWLVIMPAISFYRAACRQYAALSLDNPNSANDARSDLGLVHSSDGRGRRGRRGTDHLAAHPAHDYFRFARRAERCAHRRRRSIQRGEPHRPRCADARRGARHRRDHDHDVDPAHFPPDQRRANQLVAESVCGSIRRCVWISVRYSRWTHQRPSRQFVESYQRHEHRHAHGHLRDFFVAGWTAPNYQVLALMIGGVVCIAAAIAGATSQDLKTGYLVGATPFWQQMGLLIGVTVSTLAIGTTLNLMNKGLEKYLPTEIPVNIQTLPSGVKIERDTFVYHGKNYTLINSLGSHEIPDGEYLYDPGTKQIEFQWAQGIGSDKAPAPQARLMATVISGILNQRLPWRLVLMGVALVIAIEILGVRSLAFATGSYLPLGTTAAMFAGALVRMAVEATTKKKDESEASPGALFSSGLIAAGGVFGLLGIIINLFQDPEISNNVPHWLTESLRLPWRADLFSFGPKLLGPLATSNLFGLIMFLVLAASLFYFARKKLD